MNDQRLKIIAGVAILLVIWSAGWQIGKWELANVELRDDMHDMASQLGARIGFSAPLSDEEFRNEVMRKAQKYGIQLSPEQVTVVRTGEGLDTRMYLAANYSVPVQLPGFSFHLHFTPKAASFEHVD